MKRTIGPTYAQLAVLFRRTLKYITLEQSCLRPGALEILKAPSRISHTLFYPSGKIERSEA